MAHIYTHNKNGKKYALNAENLNKLRRQKIWIDLKDPTDDDIKLLQSTIKLHPTTVEDIRVHNSRTKIEEFKNYLSVVMYDIVKKKGELERSEINLIISNNYIITAYQHEIKEIEEIKKKPKKLAKMLSEGTDALLYHFMDNVIGHYIPFMEKIEDEIDNVEVEVTRNTDKKLLNKIIDIRRDTIIIKKLIHPQIGKLGLMADIQSKFIRESKRPYFRDLYDDSVRVNESVENAREAINSTYDMFMSSISFSTNEVMKVLSIAATIMMPLTFITGVFGMNFKYMPGMNNILGFWISAIAMLIIALLLVAFFRKQKWL